MKKANKIIKGTNIIQTFDNGSKVVQLLTKKAQQMDRKQLNYKNKISNSIRVPADFSLRDKHNNILANIELSYASIFNIQGKNGEEIKDATVKEQCLDFIAKTMMKADYRNTNPSIINNFDLYVQEAKARAR